MDRSTDLRRRATAVLVAGAVGVVVAATNSGPRLPAGLDCAGTTWLATSPLYDHDRFVAVSPTEAVADLAAAGGLGAVTTLQGLAVELHEAPGPRAPSAPDAAAGPPRLVVVARDAGRPVVLAEVVSDPARGWQVDAALACSTDPVPTDLERGPGADDAEVGR